MKKCEVCEAELEDNQLVGVNGRWVCPKEACLDAVFAPIAAFRDEALRALEERGE